LEGCVGDHAGRGHSLPTAIALAAGRDRTSLPHLDAPIVRSPALATGMEQALPPAGRCHCRISDFPNRYGLRPARQPSERHHGPVRSGGAMPGDGRPYDPRERQQAEATGGRVIATNAGCVHRPTLAARGRGPVRSALCRLLPSLYSDSPVFPPSQASLPPASCYLPSSHKVMH